MLVAVVAAWPSSAAADPLVGQWHLDVSNPSCPGACSPSYTTPDSSSTGFDIGPATTDPISLTSGGGRWGNALSASNSHVLIKPAPAALQPDDLTVVAWVRHNGYPGPYQYIVGEGDNGATCTAASYAMYTGVGPAHGMFFYVDTTGGLALSPPAGPPDASSLWDGQWHMVAGTFDGSAVRLYVDGTEVTPANTTPQTSIIDYTLSGHNFFIDGYPPVGCVGNSDYTGDVDELRVYDRALSATEIGRLASDTGPTPPVLVPDGTTDVHTTGVGALSPTSATILGTIDDHGAQQSYHAEYGTSTSYGHVSANSQTVGSNTGPKPVSVTITGLTPGTDYHARLVSTSAGEDVSFHTPQMTTTTTTTPPPPPPPVITKLTSYGSSAAPGTPAIVNAELSEPATVIQWNVAGHTVSCPGSEPTIVFPAATAGLGSHRAPRTTTLSSTFVSVRAIGPGGLGPALGEPVTLAPPPKTSLPNTVVSAINAEVSKSPVYVCTGPTTLVGIQPGESVSEWLKRNNSKCFEATLQAPTLRIRGCFTPIANVSDVPTDEQQTLAPLLAQRFATSNENAVLKLTQGLISDHSILVNGVEFKPQAPIVYDSDVNRLITSGATLSVGGIPLDNPRAFQLDTSGTGPINLGPQARGAGGLVTLGGLGLLGDVNVTIDRGNSTDAHSDIATSIQLPAFLGGGHADVTGRLGPDGNFVVNTLDIKEPKIEVPGIASLKDFEVRYADGVWNGQGALCVTDVACLTAIPTSTPPGGVTIGPGDAFRVFGHVTFPAPGVMLGTDVFLADVGFGVGYPPVRVLASAALNISPPLFTANGAVVLAFPSASQPYRLDQDRDTIGNNFPPDAYGVPRTTFTVAASANATMKVPVVGDVPLAHAYLLYQAPGIVRLGGSVALKAFDVIKINGSVSGDFDFSRGTFNVLGNVSACISDVPLFGDACLGATGIVSDRGAGACTSVGPFSVGGGVVWKPSFDVHIWVFDGCRWSPFADFNAAHIAADTPVTVRTKAGDRSREVELDGSTGAPSVHVVAANGQKLDSSAGPGLVYNSSIRIFRSEKLKMTVVGFVNPGAGNNTISLLPGSPPVAHSSIAVDQPAAHVTAGVSGSGAHRVLMYRLGKRRAQKVTFYEQVGDATRKIGTTTHVRGSLKFTATPSPGRSSIVAQFTLAGMPGERITIAHFMPPSPKLGRVRKLRVSRRGPTVSVSWARVADAARYEVIATLKTGAQQIVFTHGRSVKLRHIQRWSAGRVTVRALAPLREGPVAAGRFHANGPRPRGAFKLLTKPRKHRH
jgi:hypothetical protein